MDARSEMRAAAWQVAAHTCFLLGGLFLVLPFLLEPVWVRVASALNMTLAPPADGGTSLVFLVLTFAIAFLAVGAVAMLNAWSLGRASPQGGAQELVDEAPPG